MQSTLRTIASAAAALLVSLATLAPAGALELQLNTLGGSSFSNMNDAPISIDVELTFSDMDWTDDFFGSFAIGGGKFELLENSVGEIVLTSVETPLLSLQAGSPFAITNFQPGTFFSSVFSPTVVTGPSDGPGPIKYLSGLFLNFDSSLPDLDWIPVQIATSGQIATFTIVAPGGLSAQTWDLPRSWNLEVAAMFIDASNELPEIAASTSQVLTITAIPEPGTWALITGGLAVVAFGVRRRERAITA